MVLQELINLILADEPVLNEPALCRLLEQNGFADGRAAARSLLRLCADAQQSGCFRGVCPAPVRGAVRRGRPRPGAGNL